MAWSSAQLVDQAGCRRPTHIVERGRVQGSRTRPNRSRPLTGILRGRALRRWRLDDLVPSLAVGFAAVHQPAAVALHFFKQIGHLQRCQFRLAEHRVVGDGEQGTVAGVNQLLPRALEQALAQRPGQPRRLVLAPPLAVVHALDINDGVRINIRSFMAHDIPTGKKGPGTLRVKPNVHWKKERGKESMRVQRQYPWSWRSGKFTGKRSNDLPFTVAKKDGGL